MSLTWKDDVLTTGWKRPKSHSSYTSYPRIEVVCFVSIHNSSFRLCSCWWFLMWIRWVVPPSYWYHQSSDTPTMPPFRCLGLYGRKNKVWESLFKIKRIFFNFYILFNDSQNVINNFYYKMNIFINLPFEFLRKNLLFSFGYDKYIFMIYDCFYNK